MAPKMLQAAKPLPTLRSIPEDRSRTSGSNTTESAPAPTPNLGLPESPIPLPVKVKKDKKDKSKKKTKKIKQFDDHGNIISEKRVKVDEFGNPIKKKKTSKLKQRGSSSSLLSHDSVSTMGLMSAAEVVRQTVYPPFRPSWSAPTPQQHHQQQQQQHQHQQQQQQQHHQQDFHFNNSFADSKPSASSGTRSTSTAFVNDRKAPQYDPRYTQDFRPDHNYDVEAADFALHAFGPVQVAGNGYQKGMNNQTQHQTATQMKYSECQQQGQHPFSQMPSLITQPAAAATTPHYHAVSVTAGATTVQQQSDKDELHQLVVQYMISAGADPDIAEQMATQFEQQQQAGIDTYAAATRFPNSPDGRTSHDIDKFAMFADGDDDDDGGSIASAIVRALAQGAARAEQEQNELLPNASTIPPISSSATTTTTTTNTWASHSSEQPPFVHANTTSRKQPRPHPRLPNSTTATAAASGREYQNTPLTPSTLEDDPDSMRALLVQYLLSVGTDPLVADEMAAQFDAQQADPNAPMFQREPSVASIHSIGSPLTAEHQETMHSFHHKHNEAMTGGYRHQQSIPHENRSHTGQTHGYSAMTQPIPVNTQWSRADRPGAVIMEGRAFGAPRRSEDRQYLPGVDDLEVEREVAASPHILEAVPVKDNEYTGDLVYAESSTFGLKHMLRERSVRRMLTLFCLIIVAVTIGATVITLKNGSRATPVDGFTIAPTGSPSTSPTLISDDIEQAAIAISGNVTVLATGSPQRRAVGWMSSDDLFDTQGLGLLFAHRYILTVFYFATYGEDWLDREKWLSPDLHVCDWGSGITCEIDLTRRRVVTGIDVTRNGLRGSVPYELHQLDGLTLLRLAKNTLNGTIPDLLTDLTSLTRLDLSENKLSGSLPRKIGMFHDLLFLELSDNLLSGTIPTSLYDLGLLKKLDLSKNNISGQLSQGVSNLTSLGSLNVQHNRLTGRIPEFRDLKPLDFILLDFNQFSGSFPVVDKAMLGRLEFSLSHNNITGRIPGLESVNVSDFDNLIYNLRKVDLSYNQLTGSLPALVSVIPSMRYVDVSGNSFSGLIPAQTLSGWKALEFIAAADNKFTGTVPIGFSVALTSLDFSNNKLTGGIPLELYNNFPRLEYLNLGGNNLGGQVDESLGKLGSLRDLHLDGCNLTGTIPDDIRGLTKLEYLSVNDNHFVGSIPTLLGILTVLKKIELENNTLTGPLPSEIGLLSLLEKLSVANNSLTGLLSGSLGVLEKLDSFDVSGNLFVGSIPEGICNNVEVTRAMVGCNLECSCCNDTGSSVVCGRGENIFLVSFP